MNESDLKKTAMQRAGQKGRAHIVCFDYLRLFAMSSVIFMHTASPLLRGARTLGWYGEIVLTALSFSAVPLFFMMSGALLLSSSRTADIRLLWGKRIPRLLLPLLFWSIATILLNRYWGGKTPEESLQSFLAIPHTPAYGHLWYMYTLIALYAISPFLYHMVQGMDRRGSVYLAVLIFAILALDMLQVLAPPEVRPYLQLNLASSLRFLETNLFPFLLGLLIFRWGRRIENWKLIVATLIIFGVIVAGTWLRTRQDGAFNASFLQQNAGWEITLASLIFLLAKQILHRPLRLQLSRELVRLSMPIYLMHNMVKYALWRWGIFAGRFLSLILVCLLILVISYLVSKTLASVPGLCWVSTGIPWAEAKDSCSWQATFRRLFKRK